VSRDAYFFEGLNIIKQYFMCMLWWFSRSFKGFHFLFASLK
jgi:hypothetical protein